MYDPAKIEEAVLALLGAFAFEDGRSWKGFDFEVLKGLHEKGLVMDPFGKAKSVLLTGEGLAPAKEAASRLFGGSEMGGAA